MGAQARRLEGFGLTLSAPVASTMSELRRAEVAHANPPSTGARLLFYSHSSRAFASTLIGHLYELAQHYPVVLLTEPLAERTSHLLANRTLFPRLERVVPVQGLGFTPRELWQNNRRWRDLARRAMAETRPDVVVAENDMASLFEMYLLREAHRCGAATLTIQAMANFREADNVLWAELLHVHPGGHQPSRLLGAARRLRMHIRKFLGHQLVHRVLPWSIGECALAGRSSYIHYRGASGMRDGDLNLVLTPDTFSEFAQRGVPPAKLAVLRHPLARDVPQELFWDPAPVDRGAHRPPVALLLLTFATEGFVRSSLQPFSGPQRTETYRRVVATVRSCLPNWDIVLKPHPNWQSAEAVARYLGPLPPGVEIAPPSSAVEPMVSSAAAIIDLPPAGSTVLFTSSCAFKHKPIIAANVRNEFYGDNYRDFPGIDYVDSWESLETLLCRISDGTYRKPAPLAATPREVPEFANARSAVETLLRRRHL